MSMSGKRTAEATRWYRQAVYDLSAARWNIEGGFHDTACFLAQQAGEKALKSLLYYLGARRTALLTHSLVEMARVAAKKVEPLTGLRPECRELDLTLHPLALPERSSEWLPARVLRAGHGRPGHAPRRHKSYR